MSMPDSDTPTCPLCEALVRPESAFAIPSASLKIRQILSIESLNSLSSQPSVVYKRIADMYNEHIASILREAGETCPDWSPTIVQTHFENHCVCPRLELLRQMKTLKMLQTKSFGQLVRNDTTEIDAKHLDVFLKISRAIGDVQKQLILVQKMETAHGLASEMPSLTLSNKRKRTSPQTDQMMKAFSEEDDEDD